MEHRQTIIASIQTLCAISFLFIPQNSFGHDHNESRAKIIWNGSNTIKAGPRLLQFDLFDKVRKSNLTDKDLDVVHEKVLHTFIFDDALESYQHVHPEYKEGHWNIQADIPKNGTYFFYTQGQITDKGTEFTTFKKFKVTDGEKANKVENLGDVRKGSDGPSTVTLDNSKLTSLKQLMIMVYFSRSDDKEPEIKNYLGAMAHVVVTTDDGKSLIHVHPMETGNTNTMMLHVEFPKKGNYRVWVQFMDHDELKTIPLSLSVLK